MDRNGSEMSQLTYSQYFHRLIFLEAVAKANPSVLKELAGVCYPAFLKLFTFTDEDDRKRDEYQLLLKSGMVGSSVFESQGITGPLKALITIKRDSKQRTRDWQGDAIRLEYLDLTSKDGKAFLEGLRKWADKYGLSTPWAMDSAILTLNHWVCHPYEERVAFLIHRWVPKQGNSRGISFLGQFRFEIEIEWHLTESRDHFKKRVDVKLEEAIGSLDAVRNAEGLDPDNKQNSDRFRWLAMYQTMNKSPEQIRLAEPKGGRNVSASRIMQAYRKAAAACDIQLRPGARGPSRVEK